jgi:hypothetical protein
MILPWAHRLTQPGRTVCVVFRASPLIWPTLFGATHAPRPLFMVTPAGFFLAGLWVLGGGSPSPPLGATGMAGKEVAPKQKKAPIG